MVAESYLDGTPCSCDKMERTYYTSGELEYESPMVNGLIHGMQMLYEPYEVYNGSDLVFYENWTVKYSTPYVNGIIQGIGYGYYHNGNVSIEKHFKNNACVYQKTFYLTGKIETEVGLLNEQKHGVEKLYFESGKLAEEVPYVNGVICGERIIYHGQSIFEKGWLIDCCGPFDYPNAKEGCITKITYANGVRHGLETTHTSDGLLGYEVMWKNGKRMGIGKTYFADSTILKTTIYEYESDELTNVVDTYAFDQVDMPCLTYGEVSDFGETTISIDGSLIFHSYEYTYLGEKYCMENKQNNVGLIISSSLYKNGVVIKEGRIMKIWSETLVNQTKQILSLEDFAPFIMNASLSKCGVFLKNSNGRFGFVSLDSCIAQSYQITDLDTQSILNTYSSVDEIVAENWVVD